MEKQDWIVDVLADIAAHTEAKGMQKSFEALMDTMFVVAEELQLKKTSIELTFDSPTAEHPMMRLVRN